MAVIYPRISEKAYHSANELNVYTFVVPENVNKHTVKSEIEKEYNVSVVSVNISTLKGKNKRFMMRRGKQSTGSRSDVKKAYVTLKEGDTIPVFAETDTDETTQATAAISAKKGKK